MEGQTKAQWQLGVGVSRLSPLWISQPVLQVACTSKSPQVHREFATWSSDCSGPYANRAGDLEEGTRRQERLKLCAPRPRTPASCGSWRVGTVHLSLRRGVALPCLHLDMWPPEPETMCSGCVKAAPPPHLWPFAVATPVCCPS